MRVPMERWPLRRRVISRLACSSLDRNASGLASASGVISDSASSRAPRPMKKSTVLPRCGPPNRTAATSAGTSRGSGRWVAACARSARSCLARVRVGQQDAEWSDRPLVVPFGCGLEAERSAGVLPGLPDQALAAVRPGHAVRGVWLGLEQPQRGLGGSRVWVAHQAGHHGPRDRRGRVVLDRPEDHLKRFAGLHPGDPAQRRLDNPNVRAGEQPDQAVEPRAGVEQAVQGLEVVGVDRVRP